jgi:hypothetical protein
MGLAELNAYSNAMQALGTFATPVVVAIIGAKFIRQQAVHEAALTERVKHYGRLCPLINRIYAYRLRRGDFLNQSPESILKAKRVADHEFWAFFYVWSEQFKQSYFEFMKDCFAEFQGEGKKALINVESQHHSIKAKPSTTNADGTPWPGFSGNSVNRQRLTALYHSLMAIISADIGLRTSRRQLRRENRDALR